jgi:hypothetical protein
VCEKFPVEAQGGLDIGRMGFTDLLDELDHRVVDIGQAGTRRCIGRQWDGWKEAAGGRRRVEGRRSE